MIKDINYILDFMKVGQMSMPKDDEEKTVTESKGGNEVTPMPKDDGEVAPMPKDDGGDSAKSDKKQTDPKSATPTSSVSVKPGSGLKSSPSSGKTDIKSKIVELQQAILEFKNVAQSTDFGSFENPGVRDRETKPEWKNFLNSTEQKQLDANKLKLDQYYKGKIQLNGEEAETLEKAVKDGEAKARFNSLDPSLQGHKPAGDILLDQWITPATESVKFWQTHSKDKPDQFLTVDVQHPDRSEKGVGATAPVDFKGLIDTIGRIRYSKNLSCLAP